MMKWTSSNSSLNSPNDRKSVFYTNTEVTGIIKKRNSVSDNIFTFKMGDDTADETAQSQKSKSSTVKNNNDEKSGDLKKYLQNYMLFSNLEKESEKKCRDEQLSKIVKALFSFESKLRQEQQIIQQQLYEKDVVINQQMHTISNMKELYGVECEGGDAFDESCLPETAKYCPMCRKQYYLMNLKNISTQTNDQNNNNNKYPISIIKSSHNSDDYSSIQSIEYMSSSDEQKSLLSPNPFSTARRSKKYTSKKSYKEYLKTRLHTTPINCINNNNNINNNTNTSSDFPNSDSNNNNKSNNNINISNETNRTNRENLNGMESNGKTSGAKFSLIMNDIHGIKHQQQSHDAYDTHSLKVNRMHGINHNGNNEVSSTLNNYQQQKLNGNDIGNIANANSNRDNGGIESKENLITITNVNEDKALYNNTTATQRINNSPLSHNGHHNVTTISTNKTVIGLDSTHKYTEGMELNKKIATTDDWYVSASDVEDSDSTVMGKSYGKSTVNPVLECVNQILLQQSMDEFMDSSNDNKSNMEQKSPKEGQPRSSKRVHFSTQNSMVQVPRNSTPQSEMKNSYEIQSIYSNEYEQVGGSDNTSNANFYVDMEVKLDSDDNDRDSFEKRKIPPALPPKPANLIKLQQISKQRLVNQKQPILKQKKLSDYDPSESEPDYCSISEIQDAVKSVKIVTSAEIHNNADNDYSEIKEDIEVSIMKALPSPPPLPSPSLPSASLSEMDESFADVPKLPNVTEIIAPQTPRKDPTNKCIGHDNYITKSPFSKKSAIQNNKDSIAILAEINNIKMLPSKPSPTRKLAPSTPLDNINHQQTIKIVDDKLQEEFDWYNLDAEYDRPANSQPEVIKEMDNIADLYQFDENLNSMGDVDDDDPKVEYNLDFEYDHHEQDIVEIESNNNFTTVIKINNEPSTNNTTTNNNNNDDPLASPVSNPTTNNFIELAETPKIDFHLKKKLNYEKFLKESGLASKMLPMPTRKNNNRMFYAGPFV